MEWSELQASDLDCKPCLRTSGLKYHERYGQIVPPPWAQQGAKAWENFVTSNATAYGFSSA